MQQGFSGDFIKLAIKSQFRIAREGQLDKQLSRKNILVGHSRKRGKIHIVDNPDKLLTD